MPAPVHALWLELLLASTLQGTSARRHLRASRTLAVQPPPPDDDVTHTKHLEPLPQPELPKDSGRSSKFYDRCPANGAPSSPGKHMFVAMQSHSRSAVPQCADGTLIGHISSLGYNTSCCKAYAYCGGCAQINGSTCALCQGGYRLMGQMGYQKCTMCDDMESWTDPSSLTCSDYERLGLCINSQPPKKDVPNKGLKPSDACCACGGGDITETPWSYPQSGIAFYPGQSVDIKPWPQTAFRYEIDSGCTMSDLGLQMNADGEITGTTPTNSSSSDGAVIKCQITAVQDPLAGLQSSQPLEISLQDLSYGPSLITFALKDGLDWPTGKFEYQLNDGRIDFNLTSYTCMPLVPWIDIRPDGTLYYVTGSKAVSGGISGAGTSSFDGGQCTLKGVRATGGQELKMTFMVLKIHVWSSMEYKSVVFARKGRPIVPMRLTRIPPTGFSLYTDKSTGKEYWFRSNGSEWVPPAAPPTVLDVNCTGAEMMRWSRRTGAVTVLGQVAFYISPDDGTISGTPVVDMPERLGQASITAICYVAAGGPSYDDVLQATAEIRILDDTCYFPQVPSGPVNAQDVTSGAGSCRSKCRRRMDCSGYWEEGQNCWVITSKSSNAGVSKTVASFTARAKCEEGATCIYLKATTAQFIQGKYCPKGKRDDVTIYSRAGQTREDELFLAYGINNGTCPIPGHANADIKYWVVRRASENDFMDPETGESELRGEPLACLAQDIERQAFELGVTTADLSLAGSVYADTDLTASEVAAHKSGLTAQVSLTANECMLELSDDSMRAGPFPSQSVSLSTALYSLDPCECFGKKYRDTSPVSEESRAAAGSPTDIEYNSFEPPPMLIFEGPYSCEQEGVLPSGQKNEVSEDDCRSECFAEGSICKFFQYTSQLRFCVLLSQCNRLGHTGLEMTTKLYGVFPAGRYCRIADPELCWASKLRRDLVEGQFEGNSLASGAVTGPTDDGGSDNCAFQEQIAQCDAMHMLTTESRGTCSRCAYYGIGSTAAAGRSKYPMPPTFLAGEQVALSCNGDSRLINTKTGLGMDKAVLTCVDGEWRDAGFLEAIAVTSNADRAVEVMMQTPQHNEAVYSDKPDIKFSSMGDFANKDLLYIRGADAEKSVAADTAVWTLDSPVPVVVFLDFWGGEPPTGSGCSAWLHAPDSHWVKTLMTGSSFIDGSVKGPGVVYRQDFAAGVIEIMGNANCGTGNFLAFMDPLDVNGDELGMALSRLSCTDCIQLAQLEYSDLLRDSAPEMYYISRRKVQYHFGEVSSGCKTATQATAAPLATHEPDSCLTTSGPTTAEVNRDCSELWIHDTKKRLVSTSSNTCLNEQGSMTACSSCDSGTACTWHFSSLNQVRNSQGQCLRNNVGTLAVVTCSTTAVDQEKWYFDGGDCRYKMELKSTDIPLMFRFIAADGAMYGAQMEAEATQALASAKTSIPPMAFGNCKVMFKAKLSAADEGMIQNVSLNGATGQLEAEYTRAIMWKVDDGAYFACSPGGAGGVKAANEAKTEIAKKQARWATLGTTCDKVVKQDKNQNAEHAQHWTGWDAEFDAYDSGKAITSIHTHHNNEREDRVWKFTYSAVQPKTEPHGNPNVAISTAYSQVDSETCWDCEWTRECPVNQVLTRIWSRHDNEREDRIWRWYCSSVSGVYEQSRTDWSAATHWDGTWTYPTQNNDAEKADDRWLVGMWSRHDNEREDRVFTWKQVVLCKNKDPERAMLQAQITELQSTLNTIARKEVTCASDFLMPIADIENLEAGYEPTAMDKDGNAITVTSEAAFNCHMMHIGDPGPLPAYTMTAPQLTEMVKNIEYHGVVGEDPTREPFASSSTDAIHAMKVGYFAQIENAATLWGIQCPERSVVAVHEKVGSPHCVYVNAEGLERIIETQLPASANCPMGYAISGWWNLYGQYGRRQAADPGGPQETKGFEFRCRLVPGLSRLCEAKDSTCLENEVVVGIKYEKGVKIQYRCCQAPKTVGQLFASRHLADLQPWEGKYCPTSLDSTGRPLYKMVKHLGPNDNRHGSKSFQVTQFTVPFPETSTADSADRVIMCQPGQLLAQWRQISNSPRSYAYSCVHIGITAEVNEGLNPEGCATSTSSAAACTSGSEALQGFVVYGSNGKVKSKTCCKITAGSEELLGQTAEAPSQNPGAADVRCGEGEVMHNWAASGQQYTYKCQGFWQKLRLRGEAPSLIWDKFKGAWTITQAEVYQLRTPVRSGSSGAMSAMSNHPMNCKTGYLMKGWFMQHHGGGTTGKVSFAVQCAKVKCTGSASSHSTSGSANSLSSLTSHNVDCGSSKALHQLAFSGGRFSFQCITPTEALTSCEESFTAEIATASSMFHLEGLPVICPKRGQVLQRFQLQSGSGKLKFLLKCCTATFDAHQEAGVVSNVGQPQEYSFDTGTVDHDRVPGTAKVLGGGKPQIWLAGEEVTLSKLDMNVAAIDPVSGLVTSANMQAFTSSEGNNLAAFLNSLPRHAVVLVALTGSGLSGLTARAIFALQRCGSSLTQAVGDGYALIGVVEGARVGEATGSLAEVEAAVPPVYVAAPLVDFEASFVQEVSKSDPFPKEKPMKPALMEFSNKKPDYDKFCDPKVRQGEIVNQDGGFDNWQPVEDPPQDKTHPCYYTLTADGGDGGNGPITASKVWDCSQRDIDREYIAGVAEAQRMQFDAKTAQVENIFDWIELGATLVAAAATAIPWGSFAVPGSKGAETAVEGTEKATTAAGGKVLQRQMRRKFTKKGSVMDKIKLRGQATKRGMKETWRNSVKKAKENAGDVAEFAVDNGMALMRNSATSDGAGRHGVNAKTKDISVGGSKTEEGNMHELVPTLKPPDEFGFNDAWNMEKMNEVGWTDCNPVQWGLSKIMCDIYCTEDAVRKGTESTNTNIANSHRIMSINMERLLDYHTKMIMWGMGQLRDILLPPIGEVGQLKAEVATYRQEVTDYKTAADTAYQAAVAAAATVTPTFVQEIRQLPSMLSLNASSRAALPEGAAAWHRSASESLVKRLDSLLSGLTPQNAQELTGRAKEMVQRFVAERELRFSQPMPLRGEASVGELAEEQARQLRRSIEAGRKRLQRVSAAPKPMHLGGLALQNDEVVIRWNQLADFFIQAHEKHAVFVESRTRALDAAEAAVQGIDRYLACGLDQQKLQELWQKQVRAEEHADEVLLEAWAATVAAQERLMMSVEQGLVDRVVETSPLDPEFAKDLHCEGLSLLATKAHGAGVKSVDRSLWGLVEQLLALEKIARFQERQLRSKQLKGVTQVPVDGAVTALYRAAAGAANPADPSGLALAADALDALGPTACPAPAGCKGMRLANASFGAWVSEDPGELLRGSDLKDVVTPCTGHGSMKDLLSLVKAWDDGLISAEEVRQMHHIDKDAHSCDEQCRSQLTIHLASQRSIIAEAMLKLR